MKLQERFAAELRDELVADILPYWLDRMTDPTGGYFGRRDYSDTLIETAPRGAILNARILWTFSAAYRLLGDKTYLEAATHAFGYFSSRFIDSSYGGVYWSLNADGSPLDTKKQFYAIAFAIYGLSEYARATSSALAAELAVNLYDSIEKHSLDRVNGGYIEALGRDWKELADVRLSEKDANSPKSMNTHLHILEAYTALYRVAPSDRLASSIENLLGIFLTRIMSHETGHLGLFFNMEWRRQDNIISYGHDIEASWLLLEAALVLGRPELTDIVKNACRRIADAALEGRLDDGSMIYEAEYGGSGPDTIDGDRHWWVQAEDVVGLIWLYTMHGVEPALRKAYNSWLWIRAHLLDTGHGEWRWSIKADGMPDNTEDKAGFWKCPYHNSRMCIETIERLGNHTID